MSRSSLLLHNCGKVFEIKMGVARSKVSKILANTLWAETRMLKEVSKEKPKQAPRHPSTEEAFNTLIKGTRVDWFIR